MDGCILPHSAHEVVERVQEALGWSELLR